MNTSDYLFQNAVDERPAIITAEGTRTYGELRAAAARLAGELLALELRPETAWESWGRTRSSGWQRTSRR